ncbi:polyprenyl synthetase family protein [Actinospongicola halichondriae]|uniref:polyprenyl synthetase family protein n=1 Tax=Actinospongicola halichondriae TaxID=3236844 RepID=UPI003D41087F
MAVPPISNAVAVPPSLAQVAALVEERLTTVLDEETERWTSMTPDLAAPLDALRALVMAGGKRLRPAFCYWGFVGAGGDPDDPVVIDAGAAFEFLQAFALVHDDVMDGSSTRRGFRTAHLAFGDRHQTEVWRGERRRFGEGVAILIGDLAHVYADLLLRSAPPAVLGVWDELRIELNIGQYLDILGTARGDIDPEAARRIARYKSGKYTIERPLHVGAAVAGRYDELQAPLSAYGDPLGEAFQLRDDILGAFGESTMTGKPVGDDLREGKPTPLLAIATQQADAAQADELRRIGAEDLTDDEIASIQGVLIATGAVEVIEDDIQRLTDGALEAIADAPIIPEAKDALIDLARFVAWRES